jgi:hypothetical protein
MPVSAAWGGPWVALLAVTAALLFYGPQIISEWRQYNRTEEEEGYYTLPPVGTERDAHERACSDDLHEAQAELNRTDNSSSNTGLGLRSRRERCVCCRHLRGRYAFVRCGHVCLCEPCLILLGRESEKKRRASFHGPCKLECPLCRRESYVIRTFIG